MRGEEKVTAGNSDLEKIIEQTKKRIHQLMQQIDQTDDPAEKRRLKRRLAEQRLLQLRHLGKLG